jgi:16S rRNA processing protein RimM
LTSARPPDDLVELGAVRGAYGVKGWVRVEPFAGDSNVLQASRAWWLVGAAAPRLLELTEVRQQAGLLLAKWSGCDTRETADRLKGCRIAIARSEFPRLPDGQYYWVDLIGARVVNRQGVELGRVRDLRRTAAQDLLEIEASSGRMLVPMVAEYIDEVDVGGATIRVDWQADW